MTDVIELKQNHRQQDLEWATALENFRINQSTQSDIDFVSKRYMFDSDNNLNAPPLTLTAVPDNEMRKNVLHYCEQRVIESLPNIANENTNWRERGVLLIKARIDPKKPKKVTNTAAVAEPTPPPPPVTISLAKKEYLRKLSSKTLDCTGNLYCIVDAPYMITTNIDVSKGLANGTQAYLKDVTLKPTCEVTVVTLPSGKKVHSVCASDVVSLIFLHKITAWSNIQLFPSLPRGFFPISPSKPQAKILRFSATSKVNVSIKQLPCVLSLILTGHKVQGFSVVAIILGALGKHHKNGLSGWLYVVLSRVRTVDGLFLMEKIEQDPTKYILRSDVVKEMDRLRKIETKTIERINAADSMEFDEV